MLYVFLSICCSVIVSVLLKLARRYHIDVYQAIVWNYSIAIVLTWFFLKPKFGHLTTGPIYIYALLGILLPGLFVIIANSTRITGIVRTEIAQRLSLFIPIIAAFFMFHEKPMVLKVVGIIIGFAAIICSIPWQKSGRASRKAGGNAWLYLLLIFMGMGVIDVLFKQMALSASVSYPALLFTVFVIAFVLSLLGLFYMVATKKAKFSWPHILFGWILGVANFGNILFYIKAHKQLSGNPSTVFSAMNIGVIVVGTFIGLILFKEKLSNLNRAGIVLAIIAIIVIAYA